MVLIHQRHRRIDGPTDRQHTIARPRFALQSCTLIKHKRCITAVKYMAGWVKRTRNAKTIWVRPRRRSSFSLYVALRLPGSPKFARIAESWTQLTHGTLEPPKPHLDQLSHFSRIHGCYQRTDRQTDRQNEHGTRPVAIAASLPNVKYA